MRPKKSKLDSTNAEALSLVRIDPIRARKMAEWTFAESVNLNYAKGQADSLRVQSLLIQDTDGTLANTLAIQAVELYEDVGDESGASSVLMAIAKYSQKSGWVNRAHFILIDAFEKATRSANHKVRVAALFNLGANAEDRRDYKAALDYFQMALEAGLETGNNLAAWRASCAVQEMHFRLDDGQFDIDEVHQIQEKLADAEHYESLVEVLLFLAKVADSRNESIEARNLIKQAFSLARRAHDEQSKAEILYEFGLLRVKEGRYSSAKTLFSASLKAASVLGIHSLRLSCLQNLAGTLVKLGKAEDAYDLMSQYVALNEELSLKESEHHFQEMRSAQQLQFVEEESKVLKRQNTELGLMNTRLEAALLETQKLQRELQRLVTIDELTGAINRREIVSRGNELIARFHSQARPGAVLIVDIDHFKSINDNFGHGTGDEVLRRFTKSCQRVLRPTDYFGRLGGEEFCILLDRTKIDIAAVVAERVMRSIRSTRVSDLMGDRIVTASIGLVEINENHNTIEEALNEADTCLYEAKHTGRDKICVSGVKKKKAA